MNNVYLVSGDDPFGIQEQAKKIIQKYSESNRDDCSIEIYNEDGEKNSSDLMSEVLISLNTPPFLESKKILWLQNLTILSELKNESKKKGNDPESRSTRKLIGLIQNDFPKDSVLIISALGIGRSSDLYKTCEKAGRTTIINKPDLKNRYWRQEVAKFIRDLLAKRGMKLSEASLDFLIESFGVDTTRISNEIEKIFCYAGINPRLEDIQNLCRGTREAVFYALSNAISRRDIDAILTSIAQLSSHTKDPDQLVIGQMRYLAKFINELLYAKLLLSFFKIKSGQQLPQRIASMDEQAKEKFSLNPVLSKPDWQIRMIGSQAENFSGPELVKAISLLAEADKKLVSSNFPKRLILEKLAIDIADRSRKRP